MKLSAIAVGLLVAVLTTSNAMATDVVPTGPILDIQPKLPVWTNDTVSIDVSGTIPGQYLLLFFSPTLGSTDLGLAQLGLAMPLAMQFMGHATGTTFHATQTIPALPQLLDGVTFHSQLLMAGITFGFPIQMTIAVSNVDAMSFGS